jgi:hypothetical protein
MFLNIAVAKVFDVAKWSSVDSPTSLLPAFLLAFFSQFDALEAVVSHYFL